MLVFCIDIYAAALITPCTINLKPVNIIHANSTYHLNIFLNADHNYIMTSGPRINYCHEISSFEHGTLNLNSTTPDTLVNVYVKNLDQLTLTNTHDVDVNALQHATFDLTAKNAAFIALNGNFHLPHLAVYGNTNLTAVNGKISIDTLNNNGASQITIKNLAAKTMTINDAGSGKITLRGNTAVDKIIQTGKGLIDLYWVNSKLTKVNASGAGSVILAGKANKLVANLTRLAFLNAKYLRAKNVFVKTKRYAIAYVNPIQQLFAAATDGSIIDYYHNPVNLYKNISHEGVILPMRQE